MLPPLRDGGVPVRNLWDVLALVAIIVIIYAATILPPFIIAVGVCSLIGCK